MFAPNKRYLAVTLMTTTMSILVVACGSNNSPSTSGEGGRQSTSDSAQAQTVRWLQPNATPHLNSSVAVYSVGLKYGFFDREGVKPELTYTSGDTTLIQALAAGSADIASSDPASILKAVQKKVPVKAVASLVTSWTWRMSVKPGSRLQPTDLKGKTIGVASLASASYSFAQAFVAEAGVDVKSVHFVPVGSDAASVQALNSGKIDALALYTTVYGELTALGNTFEYWPNPVSMGPLFGSTWVSSTSALKQKRDGLVHFLRAVNETLMFSKANPAAAMRAGYEIYPQLLPAGKKVEEALPADIKILNIWLDSVTPAGDPATWRDFGLLSDSRWDTTINFTKQTTDLGASAPSIADVWDPALLADVNKDFPTQDVLARASAAPKS